MEPLWSPGVATGGNQRQVDRQSEPHKQPKSVAVGCHRLPFGSHGKEGVDGSSPSEGLKYLQNASCCCLLRRVAGRRSWRGSRDEVLQGLSAILRAPRADEGTMREHEYFPRPKRTTLPVDRGRIVVAHEASGECGRQAAAARPRRRRDLAGGTGGVGFGVAG
jgi:hypothetical protein